MSKISNKLFNHAEISKILGVLSIITFTSSK